MRASALLLVAVTASSCTPYERRSGEYYAGAVDPAGFPAPYLGAGGSPKQSGGVIAASPATAHDVAAPYYAFALSSAQANADDPLAVTPPLAYVFDARCTPPAGYAYDPRRDGYRLDEQGNVFTALPKAGYAPIVAEVPVTSNGEACQSIKSAATLKAAPDVVAGMPDGRYLAWAIVDPGATVDGPEQLGWFDHYLLTYLDGGYAPTSAAGGVVRITPQNVYFPTMIPTGAGKLGDGFDILDAARGEPGYSPLCHVFSFAPADPMNPPTSATDVDPALLEDTGTFVWCLQVQP